MFFVPVVTSRDTGYNSNAQHPFSVLVSPTKWTHAILLFYLFLEYIVWV